MENKYSFILEDNIERRRMVDKPLVNFFLWVGVYIFCVAVKDSTSFLGTLIGFGIGSTMVYLQTNRVNTFIERKTEWYKTVVDFTNKYSDDSRNLKKLNDLINPETFNVSIRSINLQNSLVSLSVYCLSTFALINSIENTEMLILVLIIAVGLSLVCIVIYEYPINAIWNKIQIFENEFDNTLSKVWKENGWIEKPIEFYIDFSKDRNFFLWIFYSIISLGIVLIVWRYKVYTDPDFMYYRFHEKEDKILEVIEKIERQHYQQKGSGVEKKK